MEFHSRKACIDYYAENFPHLPRFMIEMALDYDLDQSNKKMTGSERRKLKRAQPVQEDKEAVGVVVSGAARVVKAEDYIPAPMIKGAIEVDGAKVIETAENKDNGAE